MDRPESESMDALLTAGAPAADRDVCALDAPLDEGRLAAFRGERLGADDAAEVAGHLAACAHCRDRLRAVAEPAPDALVDRMVGAFPTPPVRRRWPWVAGAVVAAAAGLFVLLRPPPTPPPGAFEAGAPRGGLADTRSDEGGDVFVAHSQLRWAVRPLVADQPVAHARLFGALKNGPLRRLPDAHVLAVDGGGFLVRGTGLELFGPAPGARVLVLGLARSPETLDALEGHPEDQPPPDGVITLRAPIDYRGAGEGP